MDWIIWLVVIVAIVAVVWWLLNRNSSRGNSGSAGTGTGSAGDSAPLTLDFEVSYTECPGTQIEVLRGDAAFAEIGRASCRERVL